MKALIATLALTVFSLPALADCTAANFAVDGFQASPNPREHKISLAGKLVNKCSAPAAAQIRIVAKDASGRVLGSEDGWPAGTSNIAPGQSVSFDLGPLFRFSPDMADFSVNIVGVRTW
ncbi:hypothetical protein MBSD_n0558 [Mizugakiibacter sediminis]|uniref:Uncharacterized protein n=1 Tax=Mizugakiibacter sediminis TaxID=1475481 RepID=A0A0K8QKB9_9GAMM|nr:hypothetical protein [Mizugakiibacter sediminis]GAP65269.1 hypothetical protein MBSD_n0558 [Mizugakiibacter sediminis]